MSDLIGTFGLYPWFPEHGENYIHPADLERMRRLSPYGKVFECSGWEGEYLVLGYGPDAYRVRPDLFVKVPAPRFKIGDAVREVRARDRVGTVRDIEWHHKNAAPMFFLDVGGRGVSKRYAPDDLEQA